MISALRSVLATQQAETSMQQKDNDDIKIEVRHTGWEAS